MIASENDALIGGKVGGVGDVVRSLPRALTLLGWNCTVIIPSYGFLHERNPSSLLTEVAFPFYGQQSKAGIWRVEGKEPNDGVTNYVIEHAGIRGEPMYFDDPPESPFMRDATKYAMFCSAVGQFLPMLDPPDIIHLHDWHAATYLLLRDLHPRFSELARFRTVFTIHNIAIQGTRPMMGHGSSVEAWFPELFKKPEWIAKWSDPRYEEPCYSPMLAGIRYSDAVNTVSPTYAEEILQPSNPPRGYYGGEGLEQSLQEAKKSNRLFGILNGCDYPPQPPADLMSFNELLNLFAEEVSAWQSKRQDDPVHKTSLKRIDEMKGLAPSFIMTSVGRIVDQKMRLLFEKSDQGHVIDGILEILNTHNGACIILGSGDAAYEKALAERTDRYPRLLFLKGYSDKIARSLYASGTMFLMPSSFEPCGISQMIAMREGQPCIVHAVGGLKDTVRHRVNGFTFSGETPSEQANGFIQAVGEAVTTCVGHRDEWERVAASAKQARFTWEASAAQYAKIYSKNIP